MPSRGPSAEETFGRGWALTGCGKLDRAGRIGFSGNAGGDRNRGHLGGQTAAGRRLADEGSTRVALSTFTRRVRLESVEAKARGYLPATLVKLHLGSFLHQANRFGRGMPGDNQRMNDQTPMAVQLAPSVIAALALLLAALVTYSLTTRLEHRKWLRDQRLDAYDRYVLRLWKMFNDANGTRQRTDEERQEAALIADRIHLVGSGAMRKLIERQRTQLYEAARTNSDLQAILLVAVEEFRAQARKDLGSAGRPH